MEGGDAGLLNKAVDRDRSRGMTFDKRDRRRGDMVDVGEGQECLVGRVGSTRKNRGGRKRRERASRRW